MQFCFEIYQSPEDFKYYWRLWFNGEIVATGHEGHIIAQQCRNEINIVKATKDSTPDCEGSL